MTRQALRAKSFKQEFARAKEEFGSGQYSWTEGVTRQSARKIARRRAKKGGAR